MQTDYNISQLSSFDHFFYYGQSDLEYENKADMVQLAMQPRGRLFYANSYASGILEYENHPNTISLQIGSRYDCASAFAYRNTLVSNGTNGRRDRRIYVSQTSIGITQNGPEVNYEIYGIQSDGYKKLSTGKLPVGVSL